MNLLFYFLHAILCPEHTIPLKTIISDFAIVAKDNLFWLRIVTYHCSWSVTSHECGVLVLWRHIHRLFLDAQIGAKVIFTSE